MGLREYAEKHSSVRPCAVCEFFKVNEVVAREIASAMEQGYPSRAMMVRYLNDEHNADITMHQFRNHYRSNHDWTTK